MEEAAQGRRKEVEMARHQARPELDVLGRAIRIAVGSEVTGGSYAIVEEEDRSGRGSPPHANYREDITVTAVQGRVEVALPEGTVSLEPGRSVHVPRGTRHWTRNLGSEASKTLYTFVPGGFEAWFTEVAALGPAPDLEQVARIAASYGLEIAPPEQG
jgi:quercetin dioxygenase-like cupin family protein